MTPRSWLFVPADSEKKLEKTRNVAADAFILDLEDAVSPGNKAAARQRAADFLRQHGALRARLFIISTPMKTTLMFFCSNK